VGGRKKVAEAVWLGVAEGLVEAVGVKVSVAVSRLGVGDAPGVVGRMSGVTLAVRLGTESVAVRVAVVTPLSRGETSKIRPRQ
jgi:hypothetical protein